MAAKKNTVTYNGTGRRKTSVARVFMTPGKGNIVVNGKDVYKRQVHKCIKEGAYRNCAMYHTRKGG